MAGRLEMTSEQFVMQYPRLMLLRGKRVGNKVSVDGKLQEELLQASK